MTRAFWLAAGVVLGFVVAHLINKTAVGRAVFEDLDSRASAFLASVSGGYRSRESELRRGTGV